SKVMEAASAGRSRTATRMTSPSETLICVPLSSMIAYMGVLSGAPEGRVNPNRATQYTAPRLHVKRGSPLKNPQSGPPVSRRRMTATAEGGAARMHPDARDRDHRRRRGGAETRGVSGSAASGGGGAR